MHLFLCISLKKAPLDALLADAGFKRGRWSSRKLSVLRIAFDRELRDVTREQAIAQANVTRVEGKNLDESTLLLKSILRMSSLARVKVRFTEAWSISRSMCIELV